MLSASGHQVRSRMRGGEQRYLICETVGNCGSWQLLHITRTVDSWLKRGSAVAGDSGQDLITHWTVGLGLIEVCLPPARPRLYSLIIRLSYPASNFAYNSTSSRPVAMPDQRSGRKGAGGLSGPLGRLAATINALRGKWRVPSSVCRPIWLLANWKNTKVIIHKKIFVETCMGTIALDVDFSKSVRSLVGSAVQEPALFDHTYLHIYTHIYIYI